MNITHLKADLTPDQRLIRLINMADDLAAEFLVIERTPHVETVGAMLMAINARMRSIVMTPTPPTTREQMPA